MDGKEFAAIRSKLEMTQKQMAELLGRSLRAVQSIPHYVSARACNPDFSTMSITLSGDMVESTLANA